MIRIAALSDIHGNLPALEAVRRAVDAARPDYVAICGDLVFNGPDPVATLTLIRELERAGAYVTIGNTDIAVADGDFTAAFPWFTEGAPDSHLAAAEWARDQIGDDGVDYLRRLPWERRLRVGDDLVLFCHASPGSLTDGFPADLDPVVTIDRISGTDAKVIVCGHTHVPEVREVGWRTIVNDGSAGYVFDGDPSATWALIEIEAGEIKAEIKRTTYDIMAASDAVSARGLPGDVYRAATIRTGKLVR
ncbi:MAG TPA: metallophosphoesterase family protein [Candidatus Limnocylindrales bacterium]|nr:metallophosphoesterase family protein [Candidatus Limnocylindrales bacterium]